MANIENFKLETFQTRLTNDINDNLLETAEPLIHEALAKIEDALRRELAKMLVGFLTTNYDLMTDGRTLKIEVKLGERK